jgi:predicted DNA-binding transcriptional regulator AlpA
MEAVMDQALIAPEKAREISGGISESTQRRLIEAGDYPKPIVLSRTRSGKPARIAFIVSEVQEWCQRRIAAHRGSAA